MSIPELEEERREVHKDYLSADCPVRKLKLSVVIQEINRVIMMKKLGLS